MKDIAVIIPVYNEEVTIIEIIAELQAQNKYDIFVVDDSSSDSSLAKIRSTGVNVLPLAINLGAWGAIQTGLRYALKQGYKLVVTMDGDGQHHSGQINRLIQTWENNRELDVVIGAFPARGSRLRRWAWLYFRKLTGVGIEDITSGFRLYTSRAMKVLAGNQGTLLDFQDVGVLLLLQDANLEVGEVAVEMSARTSGKSHIYYSWLAVAYYMVLTTVLSLSKGKTFRIRNPKNNRNKK